MRVHQRLIPDDGPGLSRRDLLTFEHFLRDEIASVLPFKSYSLYFPKSLDNETGPMAQVARGEAAVVPKEKRVLLPLALGGKLLGVFVAKGATISAPKSLLPTLTHMARLCVEKLLLYKLSVTDPATGLGTRDLLMRAMADEISQVGDCIQPGSDKCLNTGAPGFSACFALVAARLHDLETCQDTYGAAFAAQALKAAATALLAQAPDQVLAARSADDTLVLCLPGATPGACRKLADTLATELENLSLKDPILDTYVRPQVSVGFAVYPQDMNGNALRLTPLEQAAGLLRMARRAAAVAARTGASQAFAHSQIVTEGGQVTEILPLGQLHVDLGHAVGAREGQRFLVWDAKGACKGEISLMQVSRGTSLAEVMVQADAHLAPAPGDRVTLIRETEATPKADGKATTDTTTGLLQYRDFLHQLATGRGKCKAFSLVLMRLDDTEREARERVETSLRDMSAACSEIFGTNSIGGRHSIGGLIWFLPEKTARQAKALCKTLQARLAKAGAQVPAVGVASYPMLSFSRADILDNVTKALEYARLLPEPHLGVMDSLALNIHADKFFAQGRLFDAIEEYKLALLADGKNTMARNSLGVCHARTGDIAAAKRQFKTVLRREPKDIFALYNYGYACQRNGQIDEARKAYRQCLAVDKTHAFSLIRLGEISQKNRRFADAKRYFERASDTEGGQGLTRRYLARLELARGNSDEAREHLHQALIHDPMDAVSLHLMARLYLDGGEDPGVAEALARQSAALMPSQRAFWKELARALQAQGKTEEAGKVLARAEEL